MSMNKAQKKKEVEHERVSSRGSYQREGEMSQTEVLLGYTRQSNTIQALTEKDRPRSSFSTSMGDERERQEQDSVRQEGVERRKKRDANFRRATDGQALRCVPAIDWLVRPSIPSH